jgi:hypothetical protein
MGRFIFITTLRYCRAEFFDSPFSPVLLGEVYRTRRSRPAYFGCGMTVVIMYVSSAILK